MNFKGCGTALVTPFRNGTVDYEAYASLVDRQVSCSVDFLVALATTAETPTLSASEKVELARLTKEHSGGLPVMFGVGSNSVTGTMDNIRLLAPYADAFLVVVPFYNKPTQKGMYLYYQELSRLCGWTERESPLRKPIYIYNVPGRTGANMEADTCVSIAREIPGIAGIKEASGKLDQVRAICNCAPAHFDVLSGDDDLTLEMMRCGACGCISVASNICPSEVTRMVHTRDEALDAALQPLYKACFVESNPIPVKAALSILGLCTDEMRLPLTPAASSTVNTMKGVLSDLQA